MNKQLERSRKYPKIDRLYGELMGIKITITPMSRVLDFIAYRLKNREKFYILRLSGDVLLKAIDDWLLAKTFRRSDLSLAEDQKIVWAYKEIHGDNIELINSNIFIDAILKIANEYKFKVFIFGGEDQFQERLKIKLAEKYKNIIFKTHHYMPKYNKNGQPLNKGNRRIHKNIIGTIKIFEPEIILVNMETPLQEKWIYRNFFRMTKVLGAVAVGGLFEPKFDLTKKAKKIINSNILFPLKVAEFKAKLLARK